MPRLPRIHLNGTLYYVTQQGAQDRPLFRDEQDYQTYLDLLSQYKSKHEFKLFAYSFHVEKIHLLVEPVGHTTISEIMRDLTSRYSKYCNGRYGGIGPLFKGRFHTTMAEKEALLLKLIHFIHSLSNADVSGGVENSKTLFFAGHTESAASLKLLMKTELAEVAQKLQQTGFVGGLETLAVPMNREKMDDILKILKDPVVGSPEFVRKVRSEMAEATHEPKHEIQTVSSVTNLPFRLSGLGFSAKAGLVSLILVPVLAASVSFFWMQKQVALSKAVVAAVPASQEKTTASAMPDENKTLHASVIVLEGTEWNLRLTGNSSQGKPNVEFDKISFSNDQVISKKMAAKGFQPTYYTLTTNPDGSVVWETMQTGPSGEKVFWRGEWKEDGMHGVLSQREVGGELKTFQFIGSR